MLFAMAGGGTGGHVVPALAVAAELRKQGHDSLFIGTRQGLEARLVPEAGFEIEWIDIGGLNRVGLSQKVRTLGQLGAAVLRSRELLRDRRVAAVFSMGGYVAGPVMIASVTRRLPLAVMEPNAIPGMAARQMSRFVDRALVNFEEARRYFPAGRSERCGLPVREEFFRLSWNPPGDVFRVLITGGSRGARSLNRATRDSWPLFAQSKAAVSLTLQCGAGDQADTLAREFETTGLPGHVTPFIADMPAAYAHADLVVSRSGAGALSELAAAGKPSVLVPFPFAADDHQRHNAEAMQRAGAARMVLDESFTGKALFDTVCELRGRVAELESMSRAAKSLARPGAAARAAEVMLEIATTH
jgi:UDP-N-acetylglucosamine--N-acetylmuramyl-(pentapeptide) pyrophosphoryl-undecaprenol N-acetylglucosamine transferase